MNNKIIAKAVAGITLCSMVGYTLPVFAYTKDETVYSKLDANGDSYKTIVSTHIKNAEHEELIKDISDLLNIENTSGNETFTQNGSTFTWNANKNDIYYQGETEKELPIECNIKYELDGKEVTADEIAGKSGDVKITLEYTNKEERTVNINGKNVKMYIPFVVVAGTILNNEENANIAVSNGKVVDDGSKTVIIGMAMPGLQESLGVEEDDIEISSNIEITMETTNFETNSIVSYVTPKVLEKSDLSIFDKLDEVYDKVDTLQSSSEQIEDGANSLNSGMQTLNSSVSELNSGASQISNGQSQITSGLRQIQSNLPSSSELEANKTQLNTLSAANNYAKQQLEAQVTNATAQVAELQTQLATVNAKISAIESALAAGGITINESMTDTTLDAIASGCSANITALTTSMVTSGTATQAELTALIASQQAADTINTYKALLGTKKLITANIQSLASLGETINGTATTQGLSTLIDYNEQVVQSSLKTVDSMSTLSSGVSSLVTGSKKLQSGATTLADGTQKLADGTSQLASGSQKLANGIKKFNEEGIEKICDYINGDVKDITERVEKLTDLSKEYNNFTMLNEGNEGEVKFIMIIDGIKAQEDSEQQKENAVIENNVSSDENK